MPENEIIDSDGKVASRWRPLRDRLDRGERPDAILPDLRRQFYKVLRSIFERWKSRGVDPGRLFAAAVRGPAALRGLIGQTGHDYFARLLREVTAGDPDPDRGSVIRAFLDSLWEEVRDDLRLDSREEDIPVDFLKGVDQMLERLALRLLNNPSRVPRLPPGCGRSPDVDDLLDESLPLA